MKVNIWNFYTSSPLPTLRSQNHGPQLCAFQTAIWSWALEGLNKESYYTKSLGRHAGGLGCMVGLMTVPKLRSSEHCFLSSPPQPPAASSKLGVLMIQ